MQTGMLCMLRRSFYSLEACMRRNFRPVASQTNKRRSKVLVCPLNFRAEASKTRQTVHSSPALSANLFLHVLLRTRLLCIMTLMEYCLQAATLSADSQRGGGKPRDYWRRTSIV
jgi:hypothetical protein